MKHTTYVKVVYLLAFIAMIIGFSAFGQDTLSTMQKGKDQFDQIQLHLSNLDRQLEQLNDQMQKVDFNKVQIQLDKALQILQKEKIDAKLERTLQRPEWEKLESQLQQELSTKSFHAMDQARRQIALARVQIDRQRLQAREISKLAATRARLGVDESIRRARKSMAIANNQVRNIRNLTKALREDGLLNEGRNTIEIKKGKIYINGKKQPRAINKKYKDLFRDRPEPFELDGSNGIHI